MEQKNILMENEQILSGIPNLSFRADSLATESLGVYVKEVGEYFTNKLPEISKIFSISKDRANAIDKKELTEQAKDLVKLKSNVSFVVKNVEMKNIANIETPVILGMKSNMLVTTEMLLKIGTVCTSDLITNLDNLDTNVSKILGSSDARKRSSHVNKNVLLYENIKSIGDTISFIIDKNGAVDRKPIIEVTPNIKSIETIYDNLRKINMVYDNTTIDTIKKDVSILSERISLLEEVLSDKNIGRVSKNAIKEIAYNLEDMAKYVTSAISIFYIVNQLNDMYSNMIKIIYKANS